MEERKSVRDSMGEEVFAVKLFISQVHSGHFAFVEPDPERLDFDAEKLFRQRTDKYRTAAARWLVLFQTDRESEEFKKLTKKLHDGILFWRSKNLVKGTASLHIFLEQNDLLREEIRILRKENADLYAKNLALAEKITEFRRPTLPKNEESEIVGEE